jgi:hypothetical protein
MTLGTGRSFEGQVKPSAIEVDAYEYELFAHRFAEVPTNLQGRWAYNVSNLVEYEGYAPKGLAEGTDGWLLRKYTYVGEYVTERKIAYGNWTAKATYTYE